MTLDGDYRAVLDRIEGGLAVLELNDDGDLAELRVTLDHLPPVARRQDAILEVTLRDGQLVDATYDRRATRRRRQQSQRRFDNLSRRPPKDEDDA
jgi:hypothetical protein